MAILGPVCGAFADHKDRKKIFFQTAVALGVAGCILNGFAMSWVLFIVIFVLTKIFYSMSLTFYDSMLNDITTEERMDEVSSYGYAWGYIGSCIPFIIAMVAYILGGGLSEDLMVFSPMVAKIIGFSVTGIWWLIVTLPLLKEYKQINYVEAERGEISAVFGKIYGTLRKIATHDKKVLFFLIAFFLYIDGVGTIIDNCINIGTDLGLPTVGQVVFLLATQVVAFGGSLVFAQLSKKFDTVPLILACIVGYFCVCLYALTLHTLIDFGILAFGVFRHPRVWRRVLPGIDPVPLQKLLLQDHSRGELRRIFRHLRYFCQRSVVPWFCGNRMGQAGRRYDQHSSRVSGCILRAGILLPETLG